MTKLKRPMHPYMFAAIGFLSIWIFIVTGAYLYMLNSEEWQDSASTMENVFAAANSQEHRLFMFAIAVHGIWMSIIYIYAVEYGASELCRHRRIDSHLRRLEVKVKELVGYDASCTFKDGDHMAIIRIWDVPEDMRDYVEECVYIHEKAIMPCDDWFASVIVYAPGETIAFGRNERLKGEPKA